MPEVKTYQNVTTKKIENESVEDFVVKPPKELSEYEKLREKNIKEGRTLVCFLKSQDRNSPLSLQPQTNFIHPSSWEKIKTKHG